MKTILKKYGTIIEEISDERSNGDGVWVYLKNEWADFNHDPHNPMRTVHEQTIGEVLTRLRHGVRRISDQDFYNHPDLRY